MQKTIQLFEQDFARWGLHIPEADAAARRSGAVHESGWHVLYDFGQDSRGEFLDYYAALRDSTDPAVPDDWHVRLYETGDRVQLPTVLEAYMYSRDPTRDELARSRRKFADAQVPSPAVQMAPASSTATALDDPSTPSDDIALEVGLDLALAGVEPAPGGDSLASWLMTPAFGAEMIEPAKAADQSLKPAPSHKPKATAVADDDVQASDLVFASEPPPARISGRISNPTVLVTTDDDTFTISMSDDEAPDDVQGDSPKDVVARDAIAGEVDAGDMDAGDMDAGDMDAADAAIDDVLPDLAGDSLVATTIEGIDHGYAPSRPTPSAGDRHSPGPDAMLTTDIAAVAGSFDPWWYRPTARRLAMLAAAVIAIVAVGSAVAHFRHSPAPDAASSRRAATQAAMHAVPTPPPDADADPADASGASDSPHPGDGRTPDSLPVASAPSSVTADPANPAADDGIARPAGPQSLSPIRRSGTSRAPLGPGRTTAKTGSALP